jgi:predicted 3-demethylubiquinone-9 3-methyltransferase (glyoxalase superfamily)
MRFEYTNGLAARIVFIIIVFGLTLSGCSNTASINTDVTIAVENTNNIKNTNPIDAWYAEMNKQYGNSHSDGWIAYLYGEAWKAELHNLVKEYNNTETAKKYYDSIVQTAIAAKEFLIEQEEKNGWGTSAPGRIERACAEVYRNGVYQLDAYYSDFIFDADAATREYLEGT